MKVKTPKRQNTLSFKITEDFGVILASIRLNMSNRLGRVVSKTDVIEEAIRVLAKREKVSCG